MSKWFLGAVMCCTAAVASAQSTNVQLYGFLYSGLRHVNNTGGSDLNGLATGPSRWGLRGTEDLGAGLSANFVLESGFDMSTGNLRQGGRIFGRQAFVGVGDKSWGNVTVGRQYDLVAAWIAPYTPAGKCIRASRGSAVLARTSERGAGSRRSQEGARALRRDPREDPSELASA